MQQKHENVFLIVNEVTRLDDALLVEPTVVSVSALALAGIFVF